MTQIEDFTEEELQKAGALWFPKTSLRKLIIEDRVFVEGRENVLFMEFDGETWTLPHTDLTSSVTPPPNPVHVAPDDLILATEKYLGIPYVWGGNDAIPGFDCSGLLLQVFRDLGIPLAGGVDMTAEGIRQNTTLIASENDGADVWGQVQPGDVLCFEKTYNGPERTTHIGLSYGAGTGLMIDTHEPGGVQQTQIGVGTHWQANLFEVRRHPALTPIPGVLLTDPTGYWSTEGVARASNCPAENVKVIWPLIARALYEQGIATPRVCVGMIGTVAKESAGTFKSVREAFWLYDEDPQAAYEYYADTSQHAAYIGGPEYHGRGPIQITHLPNYVAFDRAMIEKYGWHTGVVEDPDRMLDPEIGAYAAAWFFTNKIGLAAACEREDWREVRRLVLGGYGDSDGVERIKKAANFLLPLAP